MLGSYVTASLIEKITEIVQGDLNIDEACKTIGLGGEEVRGKIVDKIEGTVETVVEFSVSMFVEKVKKFGGEDLVEENESGGGILNEVKGVMFEELDEVKEVAGEVYDSATALKNGEEGGEDGEVSTEWPPRSGDPVPSVLKVNKKEI